MSGLTPPGVGNLAGAIGLGNVAVNPQGGVFKPDNTNTVSSNSGKKAVHVKWAGKTIALGTFSHAEADQKCARAKALTRAWRSTMRPKPTREWVMLELERLQVRVVSGRLGRKGEDCEEDQDDGDDDEDEDRSKQNMKKGKKDKFNRIKSDPGKNNDEGESAEDKLDARTGSFLNAAGIVGARSGMAYGLDNLGLQKDAKGKVSDGSSSEHVIAPPHRPLVGGGSAAAYEAARADHYRNVATQQQSKVNMNDMEEEDSNSKENNSSNNSDLANSMTRSMGGGLGGMKIQPQVTGSNNGFLGTGASVTPISQLGLSVNPNQHYEMLKLHHMNLLNEIQETTLMMNLYQQQQLQQQQQFAEQSLSTSSAEQQLALKLAQQQQQPSATSPFLESLYGMGSPNAMNQTQQFPSLQHQANHFQQLQQANQQPFGLGFGSVGAAAAAASTNNQMQALLRQQQNMLSGGMLDDSNRLNLQNNQLNNNHTINNDDESMREARLEQLKQDIAERQRQVEDMEKNLSNDNFSNKRQKS